MAEERRAKEVRREAQIRAEQERRERRERAAQQERDREAARLARTRAAEEDVAWAPSPRPERAASYAPTAEVPAPRPMSAEEQRALERQQAEARLAQERQARELKLIQEEEAAKRREWEENNRHILIPTRLFAALFPAVIILFMDIGLFWKLVLLATIPPFFWRLAHSSPWKFVFGLLVFSFIIYDMNS
jgi:hypothetical protein